MLSAREGMKKQAHHSVLWKRMRTALKAYPAFRYLAGGMPISRLKAFWKATPDS